jgi:3-phosphoshikimate 1-carboxyvinyltransferase
MLCERGIRTFETATRNTTDINAVPVLKNLTHLPVILDPSHSTGHSDYVAAIARAAIAAGAMVSSSRSIPILHAVSDGKQSLKPETFAEMVKQVRAIAEAMGRRIAPIKKPVTEPYVDMTIAVMRDFGVEVKCNDSQSFTIPLTHYQLPLTTYLIESDASAASYFFAAPAICGGTVRVENTSRRSVQGDIAFLDVLQQMGCTIEETDNCILVTGHSELYGIDVDMRDIPDTAQTLAVIAPFASSPTRIRGIASTRFKETDRIHATCTELTRLGVRVEEHEDGMTIYPCKTFQPANIQTYNDHRMAMAFSLIGLRVDGVTIENPSCVSKTFPNFFEVLDALRVPFPLGRGLG